jgi:hypothetical protein
MVSGSRFGGNVKTVNAQESVQTMTAGKPPNGNDSEYSRMVGGHEPTGNIIFETSRRIGLVR